MTIEDDTDRVRAVTEQLAGPEKVYVLCARDQDGDTHMAFASVQIARDELRDQVISAIEIDSSPHDGRDALLAHVEGRLASDPNTFAIDLSGNQCSWVIHPLVIQKS